MKQGQRVQPVEALEAIAQRTLTAVNSFPAPIRQVEQPLPVTPKISPALQELTQRTQQRIRKSYTEQNS
ncbi:MAG: hypothetical protein HC832_02740 [Leptolyngbyaceae cyanobacterium RM1_405_57]|nr:hypothetical protein [Leptolyngbyaceae cyanobacterium RM1_405_57]